MAYTTIDDPTVYFQVKLYTGNGTAIGSGGNSITFDGDTDLAPGMLWLKRRDSASSHNMHDEVRGAQNRVYPDTTDAEDTSVTESVNAFTSDGFNLGNSGGGNASGGTYVAWCWKANGSGSANSDGNTTTTKTSANTTSGFSIITYDGDGAAATLGHGLGAVPHVIFQKNLDDTENWQVYHHKNTSAPETDYLTLNTNNATGDQSSRWNDTAPTSTLISIGSDSSVSQSGESMVMYAWSEKQGFSKFGSYTGNGNADGTFVYTGFRPTWVMCKKSSGTGNWNITDGKRNTANPHGKQFEANVNDAEFDNVRLDMLANGFKHRASGSDLNGSGTSYIFIAFAEAPFVNSEGVPCNAR